MVVWDVQSLGAFTQEECAAMGRMGRSALAHCRTTWRRPCRF